MTSHRDCAHPKTKAARARCRKGKAEVAEILRQADIEDKIYHDTYVRPFEQQDALRVRWEDECGKFCEAHISSAEQNADDTSVEEKFEPHSKRWYEVAISTLHSARDDADKVFDLRDPEEGQYLEIADLPFWVDRVRYGDNGASKVMLINREGNRAWALVEDLIAGKTKLIPEGRTKEHHEAYSRYISEGIGDTDGYYAPIDFDSWLSTLAGSLDSTPTYW